MSNSSIHTNELYKANSTSSIDRSSTHNNEMEGKNVGSRITMYTYNLSIIITIKLMTHIYIIYNNNNNKK